MVGGWSFLLLLLIGSGNGDVVSMLDAADYFKSRNVPLAVEKMVELATQDPSDGKAQLQQLLALRWLEEEAAEVKKAKDFAAFLRKIEDVAEGRKAQDLQGFAAEYAARAARAMGSKLQLKLESMPENSVKVEALQWFPKDATFLAAIDFRLTSPKEAKDVKDMRRKLLAKIPPEVREQIYAQLEKIGNARIERFSMALVEGNNPRALKIYLRFTGKADHARLAQFFKEVGRRGQAPPQIKEDKGFRGQKVTSIDFGTPPVVAIIGNSDLILAGYEQIEGNHAEVAAQVLDIRRGKAESALSGPLAAELKKIAPKAAGVLAGALPAEIRNNLLRGNEGVRTLPQKFLIELAPGVKTFAMKMYGKGACADDAAQFAKDMERLKGMALAALQTPPPLPPNEPLPEKFFDHAKETLKSLKVTAKGDEVSGTMTIHPSFIDGGALMPLMFFGAASRPEPPPPVKKNIPPAN